MFYAFAIKKYKIFTSICTYLNNNYKKFLYINT